MLSTWLHTHTSYNIYADPSEPRLIAELQEQMLNIIAANNKVMPGINFVYGRFAIQKDNKPMIYISKDCANLTDEINSYRYAAKKDDRDAKEEPIKVDDHAIDALRYALYSHIGMNNTFMLLEDKGGKFF